MADFPNSVKNFLTLNDGVDRIVAAHPNDRGGEITAMETMLGAMGSIQTNTESFKNTLIDYIKSIKIVYKTVASLTLKAGEIAIPDASGNLRFRRNTSDLTVDWGDIDIGSEANDTYYIYAVADAAGTGFVAKISLSSSLPFGGTFYRKIGSFVNSGGDIVRSTISNDDLAINDVQKIKAWVNFDVNGTMAGSYNVVSVVKNSMGVYTITWDVDFANTTYCVVTGNKSNGGGYVEVKTKATGTLVINFLDRNGTLTTPIEIDVMAIGAQ